LFGRCHHSTSCAQNWMSPSNFSAVVTSASLMGMLERAPWRGLTPEGDDSLSADLEIESAAPTLPEMPEDGVGSRGSFGSFGSLDDYACSWPGGIRIKHTFIHLDRRECIDYDSELALPVKSVSVPSIKTYDASLLPESSGNVLEESDKLCRTPENAEDADISLPVRSKSVTFDLTPSFLCDNMLEEKTGPGARADSDCSSSSRLSRLADQRCISGDLPVYEVKNTFIQFDKANAEDADICLPVRSKSAPSMPTEIWSPTAGPAKVFLESLASDMQPTAARQCAPGSPGTPAKVLTSPLMFFPAPLSPLENVGLPLSVRSACLSDAWSSPDSNCKSSGVRSFKVKNTFIHVDNGVDADDEIGFALPEKSISQPELVCGPALNFLAAQPLPSAGAALHGSSLCKPCAWFWKTGGCRWGVECGHCHLCPEGELRRRKKDRQAELKEARTAYRGS